MRESVKLTTLIDPDCVLLIDEADQILLDYCEQFKNKQIIAVSATTSSTIHERRHLEMKPLQFKVLHSKLPGFLHANTPV